MARYYDRTGGRRITESEPDHAIVIDGVLLEPGLWRHEPVAERVDTALDTLRRLAGTYLPLSSPEFRADGYHFRARCPDGQVREVCMRFGEEAL